MGKLLIVDDDENIRTQMKWALAADHEVVFAGDRPSALDRAAADAPEVVLLDLGLPPYPNESREGLQTLSDLLAQNPHVKVIVITGQTDHDLALSTMSDGACDYMTKPIDDHELQVVVRRACYIAKLEREIRERPPGPRNDQGFEGMLGASPEMESVFHAVRKVASTAAPVLILGESGTGKEMTALAIHRQGARREGPFVALNCSAIPESLLESELFGHEKGAFTGAHVQRKGRIEAAVGGTLFLDEVGELSPLLQVKLLRFLQEQRIERVGGRVTIDVDTRVIAATNSDLKLAMQENRFREDLYYRLAVVVIRMPPLRERKGDVLLLARSFLRQAAEQNHAPVTGFSPSAIKAMEAYHWPGNVREMENRIKRAVIMTDGRKIKPSDLELDAVDGGMPGLTLKNAREVVEREMVERALTLHKGKITGAARELGISRPTLYELMDKLGLRGENDEQRRDR